MAVIEANKEIFDKEIKEGKVLVDFNASWCGPCQMLKPVLEQLSEDRKDIKFISIDTDKEEELARSFGIMSIPCLILFEDGKEINKTIGFQSKSDLEEFIGE